MGSWHCPSRGWRLSEREAKEVIVVEKSCRFAETQILRVYSCQSTLIQTTRVNRRWRRDREERWARKGDVSRTPLFSLVVPSDSDKIARTRTRKHAWTHANAWSLVYTYTFVLHHPLLKTGSKCNPLLKCDWQRVCGQMMGRMWQKKGPQGRVKTARQAKQVCARVSHFLLGIFPRRSCRSSLHTFFLSRPRSVRLSCMLTPNFAICKQLHGGLCRATGSW